MPSDDEVVALFRKLLLISEGDLAGTTTVLQKKPSDDEVVQKVALDFRR